MTGNEGNFNSGKDLKAMDFGKVKETARIFKDTTGLKTNPVGATFSREGFEEGMFKPFEGHRFCQALMKARHGKGGLVSAESISCPAAARAFGFRELPEKLKTGEGLVGFGIVADPVVGRNMFENMPALEPGRVKEIALFPLEEAPVQPDVVIVEDEVEKLMWIALAALHVFGGRRVESSTAVLQATCVDSALIPWLEERVNLSYGCYGCRDATDMGTQEAVLGLPYPLAPKIAEHLSFLSAKAIPASRSKGAFRSLEKAGWSGSCSETNGR